MRTIDILIPTYERPAALAATLATVACQSWRDFRVVVSSQDRSDTVPPEVAAAARMLAAGGVDVQILRNLPRRGMAHQRQFLLDRARAPYVLCLDDDVLLEPFVLDMLLRVIRQERCGFVGSFPVGLAYAHDVRPHQQQVEFWEDGVQPERIEPGSPAWQRARLHTAANLWHLQRRLRVTPDQPRTYRVAWLGACVLYDRSKLLECGGFQFWRDLPAQHVGEDVLAQLRVMERFGGCGVMPTGAYHQDLVTTLPERDCNAPELLGRGSREGRDGRSAGRASGQAHVPTSA